MKTLLFKISSTNEKSLGNFLKSFKKILKNKQTNLIKLGRVVETKRITTILKSPHVNKTAQEQFEKREKTVQVFIAATNFNKSFIAIKKGLIQVFHDVKIAVKYVNSSEVIKANKLKVFKKLFFKLHIANKRFHNKALFTKQAIKKIYKKKRTSTLKDYIIILTNYAEIKLGR